MKETPPAQPESSETPPDLTRVRKAHEFGQALERAFFDSESPLMKLALEADKEMHDKILAAIQDASAELIREYRKQTNLTDKEWTAATRSLG